MKYIIVGLGNFGSALAEKLTHAGNEVIGVDSSLSKVEAIKDKVTHAVAIDCVDISAISVLPIKEADVVVIAIGEDFGNSILTTALFKQLNVKRLISRAISPLHQTVLEAIGVKEIVHPESDSAARLTEILSLKGAIDVFALFDKHKVVEINLPERYIGFSVEEADIRKKYKLNILTIIRILERKNVLGKVQKKQEVVDYIGPKTVFERGDIIVVFGKTRDIKVFADSASKNS